jgi:hypothetical protein
MRVREDRNPGWPIRTLSYQQICMLNAFAANTQQAIMALLQLQSMGINEDQILNMAQQMNNGQQYVQK